MRAPSVLRHRIDRLQNRCCFPESQRLSTVEIGINARVSCLARRKDIKAAYIHTVAIKNHVPRMNRVRCCRIPQTPDMPKPQASQINTLSSST